MLLLVFDSPSVCLRDAQRVLAVPATAQVPQPLLAHPAPSFDLNPFRLPLARPARWETTNVRIAADVPPELLEVQPPSRRGQKPVSQSG